MTSDRGRILLLLLATLLLWAGCAMPVLNDSVFASMHVLTDGHGLANGVGIQCEDGSQRLITPQHVAQALGVPIRWASEDADLAVLAAPPPNGPGVRLADALPLRGSLIWVLHHPAGVIQLVSLGVLARVDDDGGLVVSAVGFFGSSGGAVLTSAGHLIGIVTDMRGTSAGLFQGVLYATGLPRIRQALVATDCLIPSEEPQ